MTKYNTGLAYERLEQAADLIEAIANVLPFRYLAFFPSQIFLEKEVHPVEGLIGAFAWAVGLYFFLRYVLNRGIKRYEAVGQ